MINDAGPTELKLAAGGGDPFDRLLAQVREAANGVYDVLGEMGRSKSGNVVYLARELESSHLVALKLSKQKGAADEFMLEVVKTLDTSMPGLESKCPECRAVLPDWERFCLRCGADLSSATFAAGVEEAEQLLDAVKQATVGEYDIFGQMSRSDGSGVVYFAKDLRRDKVVALRLRRESTDPNDGSYSIGETKVFVPLAAEPAAGQAMPESSLPASEPSPERDSASAAVPIAAPSPPTDNEAAPVAPPPSRASGSRKVSIKAIVGVAGLIAVVLGAVLMARGRDEAPVTAPPPPPPQSTPPPPPADPAGTTPAPPVPVAAPDSAVVPDSGTVVITGALPRDVRVTVDGKPVRGLSFKTVVGSHVLGISAPGYDPLTTRATVRAAQTFRWKAALTPIHSVTPPPPAHVDPPPPPPPATATCARAYGKSDWTEAASLCAKEAAAGEVPAQRMYAIMLEQARGVPQDRVQAANWYRKASDAGDREATVKLAYLLRRGEGVKKDERQAAALFKKAAEAGDVGAALEYGVLLENGDGVSKSETDAATWYKKSSDHGNPIATRRLGRLYERGKGVKKNEAEAATLYRNAAEHGDGDAAYYLGKLYKDGKGVEKSPAQALEWFQRSVQLGNREAVGEVRNLEKGRK